MGNDPRDMQLPERPQAALSRGTDEAYGSHLGRVRRRDVSPGIVRTAFAASRREEKQRTTEICRRKCGVLPCNLLPPNGRH